jgi:hypothetical protein
MAVKAAAPGLFVIPLSAIFLVDPQTGLCAH